MIPSARSRGESWVVIDTAEKAELWLRNSDTPRAAERRMSPSRGSKTISKSLRFVVLHRDGFKCTYCGRPATDVALHIDHVVPWVRGGRTEIDNLKTACLDCNLGKGARTL